MPIFTGDMVGITTLLEIKLPAHTIRVCDGGEFYFQGELYKAEDDTFGTVAGAENYGDGEGDEAPAGSIIFYPKDNAAANILVSPDMQFSEVTAWAAEYVPETGAIINSQHLLSALVDIPILKINRGERSVEFTLVSQMERFFNLNEGNRLSEAFHKSVWPGERGFDNMSGIERQIAWGVKGPPRGSSSGSGGGGGGGGYTDYRPGTSIY